MYEWSKDVIRSISQVNCLSKRNLTIVEMALRMYDVQQSILDEAIGLTDENNYQLKHKVK